ncbi:glycine oxidase ThiO [Sinorhizobium saheli]|uniref:Glycine oxidase n=1 Tax=Sinorhizobium saheli TaxID=36856 RepID=A0A178YRA5_SINSA|nr:glycine oxidase ThiO [Sinorhizobium saheli]MQW88529.1 glycine oxidase ThiO [Sinorhizobium saheli]OAP50098.1 glycine oxidase [Sinorhizobium saheli]
MTVLIKGAGVAGLAAAFELSRRGIAVEVVDAAETVGGGASSYAGGMIAPYCEREAADEAVLALGLSAADWWAEAVPGEIFRRGTLVIAAGRDSGELDRFAARTRGYERVGGNAIGKLEPDLAGRFDRALFFAEEAHLDPRKAMAGLYERLVESGVRFHLGGADSPSEASFSTVVECTGAAAIAATPGLRGVRGEMLFLETAEISLSRPVRLLHPRHPLYIVPRENNRFMVGATMIETDDDGPITARSVMEFLNAAYAVHPAFGEARVVEMGVGVRPAFADNLPRVLDRDDGFAIAGMYRHGFLLAPAMARQLAERLCGAKHPPLFSHPSFRKEAIQ